ncbi:MAG: SIS domain-containing protein [Desulfobacterales bacterium]|nr:SIS domain-containing protein [Desulfobacterales bacterium]
MRRQWHRLAAILSAPVYLGRHLSRVPAGAVVLFPAEINALPCGLAGMVAVKKRPTVPVLPDLDALETAVAVISDAGWVSGDADKAPLHADRYLSGAGALGAFFATIRDLTTDDAFFIIYTRPDARRRLEVIAEQLERIVSRESAALAEEMGRLAARDVDIMTGAIDTIKDATWCLTRELFGNIEKIKGLTGSGGAGLSRDAMGLYRQLNAVLNSIDCLEVRGRDSAGISLLVGLDRAAYNRFTQGLCRNGHGEAFEARRAATPLLNAGISVTENDDDEPGDRAVVSLALTYKIAAEIGSLGDNVRFLRQQIQTDPVLQELAQIEHRYATVLSHTRWASVGAITEANCHPVDNRTDNLPPGGSGIIHVCLNGDIDNYQTLKAECERFSGPIHPDITTDTKIIPLVVARHVSRGISVTEAFRLAVNDFDGSHAICMHTDLAPGKLFLAQKGSGQAIFIGIAQDHYMATSEVYGFIEATSRYLKMDGEKTVQGIGGPTQGQIFVLDQQSAGNLDGISAMTYDGTPLTIDESHILRTELTSRDINRQDFAHYFLKEISEAPGSVEKTLENRWKVKDGGNLLPTVSLDEKTFPRSLRSALADDSIRRIYFVGQGTAGVAAQACADILAHYMNDPALQITALKASELSGFKLDEHADLKSMADALVVAISQSGTTTDTNRTVDMVRERGAHTLAIVNRRDSDITFKVDGVMYTSSGRDLEMSVASTKAFYSQIIAGALIGLFMAGIKGRRNPEFIAGEIRQLRQIPAHMRTVLAMQDRIAESARRLAPTKTYWATVGSGPNKASADEIRIKLSELCYKTISSDFIEDKKHIDLSSEPLIIVCAAGTGGTVIGDIIKDTAIFQAHKATPIVITDQGEDRFTPFAADVFHVPPVSPHLAPILNTLVGHIWGYYAALAINECSRFLYRFRRQLQQTIDCEAAQGMDVYEMVLGKSFRENIARFYRTFRARKVRGRFPVALGLEAATDLPLLLKYLSGRLPVSDFELDFGIRGTAMNMLNTLFDRLGNAINAMSRPVDAIKHQAKTVTVGTSRISEKVEGLLFDTLESYGFTPAQLINRNIVVFKHLQGVMSEIRGAILYRIGKLNLLGDITDETFIEVIRKEGSLRALPSRVETDTRLKGTKRIIVGQGNVYIGKGRKDDRSIIVIPLISESLARPNTIEHLLLLHIGFRPQVALDARIRALGGKYEHIQNIVMENSVPWQDRLLDLVPIEELYGHSAEKIAEFIVASINGGNG